jgi:murein L,D-transpeptidase YcbB/YkuD
MRGSRLTGSWRDGVAIGTLALVLAIASGLPALAMDEKAIEAAIPVPDAANVPPLTAADVRAPTASSPVAPPAAASAPAATPATTASTGQPEKPATFAPASAASKKIDPADIAKAIPMPESADVPPPTVKDLGAMPLGRMAEADEPIGEQLRDALTERDAEKRFPLKSERTAVDAFYKARGYVPVWIENGAPTARMKAAIARLHAADADGLDSKDYPTPDLKNATTPEALADAELQLTQSLLTFARHAEGGQVSPSRVSVNIDFTPPTPEPADVLKKLAGAKDVAAALETYNPPDAGFRALKAKLAELRGRSTNEKQVVQIPAGRTMVPGAKDERVSLLRERLGVPAGEEGVYDAALVDAVKEFQKSKGLRQDGIVGANTVAAMNGRTASHKADEIVSNMERWRWLPRDLGKSYVMVNIPDFTLRVMHNGKAIYKTRIVVGKPGTPSPVFSAKIETIQVNPTWHVPQSIIYNEYLPALQQDPTVLERMGLVVERKRDGSIAIRQPPGERNALGRIKFNFPNRFQVYLHDTPDKNLFSRDRRAYSHGCMRVQNPTQFGEALLSIGGQPSEQYSAQKLQSMFGANERWLKMKSSIPVHLVYFTAYVDDANHLVVRDDLYGYDKRVQTALRGDKLPAVAERSQVVRPQRAASNAPARRYDPRSRYEARRDDPRTPRYADPRVRYDNRIPDQRSFFPFPFFQ